MSTAHAIEYSKSSRAKCHGPPPCKGSPIELGTLRYGQTSFGEYGETVEWRHWGCVTPQVLGRLATVPLERVPGFKHLRLEDKKKILQAVTSRRIDPADIPESAKTIDLSAMDSVTSSSEGPSSSQAPSSSQPPSSSQGPSQKKRKAAFETNMPSSQTSQTLSSQPSSSKRPLPSQGRYAMSQEVIDVDAEDDPPEEEARDELYCMMTASIVGVQYYKGLVGPGEHVTLVREPHNKYDRNAIQVKNIGKTQVGHIPRNIAAKLAPLLDQNMIAVEGIIHDGNLTGFSYAISMTLKIYGQASKRPQLEPLLIWATPGQRGFPARNAASSAKIPNFVPGMPAPIGSRNTMPASQSASSSRSAAGSTPAQVRTQQAQQQALRKAAELRQMLNNLEKVDDEGRRTSLLDNLCSKEDILNLPHHPSPPGIKSGDLVVDLLKHQSQALQWCIEHEYPVIPKKESDKPVQFWQFKKAGAKSYYYNIATKTPQEAMPLLGRGALCADSMGLGKTLTMLSLIIATKNDIPPDYSRTTLIVVPLSVMSNWEAQIKEHVTPGTLSSCTYYGAGRSMTPQELQQFDVVITTYQVVTGEHAETGKSKSDSDGPSKKKIKVEKGLFNVEWKRIILDEGHTIRNPKTKMAKAVCALSAQRRWVATGTPIINTPRDLGSILTFLQICRPLDNEDFFKRLVLRPLKDGDPSGAELLRALMSHICIRRTKEMQDSKGNYLVPLPPVEMTMVPVTLHDEARQLYDAIEELSQKRFENYIKQHGTANAVAVPTNVLSMLTRLRQLTLHPGLVPANYLEQLRSAGENDGAPRPTIKLTAEERIRVQALLAQAIEDNEECPICFGILSEPRITSCGHSFCLPCITEVVTRDPKCPMDRRQLSLGDLIEPPPVTDLTQLSVQREQDEDDSTGLRSGSSAKIDQLVHLLKLTPSTEKSLVFSQFTSFLDKIAEALSQEGISFVRFDGKLSAKKRQEAIERFSVPLTDEANAAVAVVTHSKRPRTSRLSQAVIDVDEDNDMDADFVANPTEDDDDDFLDDDDDQVWTKRPGKGKAKAKHSRKSDTGLGYSLSVGGNPQIMLISLKSGSLGLNLTVANNVYLMDPWWQEGIESQAIDRVNRIGQKKPVHVYQLIAENTVESKVIDIQEKKKKLIKEAFSGIKSNETQRQKKEARLQDLIELFGVRRQAASQTGGVSIVQDAGSA